METSKISYNFLKQSYLSAVSNYDFYVNNKKEKSWDYVVITASNQKQADYYEKQIKYRLDNDLIPSNIDYIVLSDLNDKRIGSGGATLNVIVELFKKDKNFLDKKILLIHSGGDSKRVPQYSVCGKLFSPVPRMLKDKYRSTLFDELMITTIGVSTRINNGILVVPGDTIFLFNSLQLDFDSCDAAGLSLKEEVEVGKEHGVFLVDENKYVRKFLHKLSSDALFESGAVDKNNLLHLDTGFIWLSKNVILEILDLFLNDEKKFKDEFINDKVRLSFYADLLFPFGSDATIDEYYEVIPENDFSSELKKCRTKLWDKLSKFKLKVLNLNPSNYIHFGTNTELINLMTKEISCFDYLMWSKNTASEKYNFSSNLCLVNEKSIVNSDSYIEDSIVNNSTVGRNTIISSSYICDKKIPEDVVIHTVKLNNGKFVTRIIGVYDNPKSTFDGSYLKSSIRKFCKLLNITTNSICSKVNKTIWDAEIFPEFDTIDESVDYALFIYNTTNGLLDENYLKKYSEVKKYSFKTSFDNANTDFVFEWQEKLILNFKIKKILSEIKNQCYLDDIANNLDEKIISFMASYVENNKKNLDYLTYSRLKILLSIVCEKNSSSINNKYSLDYEDDCYNNIAQNIINEHFKIYPLAKNVKIAKENVKVELPVRVNFCGSPSDAAPYCLEFGGSQINTTILLKNDYPIKVNISKISKKCIRIISEDLNIEKDFDSLDELKQCSNLHDSFNLFKATLIASGLFDYNDFKSLSDLLDSIGGGFEITSRVDVPKGSGLGTSSILVSAILKALYMFFNIEIDNQKIYSQVFVTEQLMATGGGWQDQVGGLTKGLKLIQTDPGKNQFINLEYVNPRDEIKKEMSERFVLIFSGQRRLARNVLRQEMTTLFKNNPKALSYLSEIQDISILMKYNVLKGDITKFANNMTRQFELVKMLDKGASNECIELIFDSIDDLIDGKSICGAGGGGFLMCFLKKNKTVAELKERIDSVFQDCGVQVWDAELLW